MKSVFTLNPFIERMLTGARYDVPKLVNAIQASLNSAAQTGEKSTRGNVKLVSKDTAYRFSEGTQTQYEGRTDAPAKFARWHDGQARLFKVCGEPSGELSPEIIPAADKAWLDDKFHLDKVSAPAKNRRNGNVDKVPAPAVPA